MDLKNILIFRVGHLGDTVIALPAFWAIRKAFPAARITLLTNFDVRNPQYLSPRSVLPQVGLIDDWVAYPTGKGRVASALAVIRLAVELRRRKFDSVFYLMPRIRTTAQIERDLKFFSFSGIGKVLCANHFRKHALGVPISKPVATVETEHRFLLDCLASENIHETTGKGAHDLLLTGPERSAAARWLSETGGRDIENRKLIAIAPGSKWESKEWMEERFAEVGSRLIQNDRCYPVIFGGREEREKGERLLGIWGIGANSAGRLSVRESAALLETCELYLGNDTGTMHLAAAVGTPCVAIFAAIDWPGRWLPFGDRNTCFRRVVECEGCHTADCFNAHKCLDLVSANDVHDACKKVLDAID